MSDKNNSTGPVAIGFPGLLAIVFITLKLCGAIDWSWWYVTMPLWIVPAILLISRILLPFSSPASPSLLWPCSKS
jgi:hypothetical protein